MVTAATGKLKTVHPRQVSRDKLLVEARKALV
jgi:hypothetical protein